MVLVTKLANSLLKELLIIIADQIKNMFNIILAMIKSLIYRVVNFFTSCFKKGVEKAAETQLKVLGKQATPEPP